MDKLASEYKVLIVDDVPTNVMLVQAILKKEGYTLLTCDSGTKALRIANEKHPNLILLDIMMPEMDGYEVLQHLKSNPETTDIPVIIMSALSDMQSIVKGYQLGATEYVTKPFQREELVKRVAHRYELYSIKRIKAELENTIESRDTLYSVIAHDLRSPLGSLKMMNNAILMMVDKERVGDEGYEMIQMMNKTSEEIFLLLDNLLKWAKNRLNKQHVYKQQTDINSIIDSTAEMYVPMAAQKGVKIILENLDKELVGLVDIDMLKTIIRNLISNAMKFSFEGGTITLSSRSEGDFVTVSVKQGHQERGSRQALETRLAFHDLRDEERERLRSGIDALQGLRGASWRKALVRVRGRGQRNDLPVLDEGAEPRGIADRHTACLYRS